MAGDRVSALRRTGLTAAPDEAFDRFAQTVCLALQVPVALVTLVEPGRQVFPGAYGLAEPWLQRRETPLSHSFCQHAVGSSAPWIVEDARADLRVAGSLAITELNVVGYAGMPLTDDAGVVLGALCAIDTVPRRWSDIELALLANLAAACSDGLRLRIATHTARHGQAVAREQSATSDAAFDRSQSLLNASVALANTNTAADVVGVIRELLTGTLNPAYVGLSLLDGAGQVNVQAGSDLPARVAERWSNYAGTATTPSALAARIGAPVLLPDFASVLALTPDAADTFIEMGWQAAASVPLPGPAGPTGALTFVWKQPHALDATEQVVLVALAGYVAQALHRADYLSSRERVAAVLQKAMLTDLPSAAPFELAARYDPAARGQHVGGDWYDAVSLDRQYLALVIGDVTGHDMQAAARMGQLRNMLRLLLADRYEPPSALLRRLESANQVLGDRITATAVLAYLRPEPTGDGHRLHWSNAGHPSPLMITDGGVTELTGRDPLLGLLRRTSRANHSTHVPPGSTVLFYTDGLIENRTHAFEDRERHLQVAVPRLDRLPLARLLDQLYTDFAGIDHEDDVALLAVRTPRA